MTPKIVDLEAKAKSLREQLHAVEAELANARRDAAEFSVGDEVEASRNGRDWEPAVIRVVEPQSFGDWYKVSYRKKDGTWSRAVRYAFSNVRASVPELGET